MSNAETKAFNEDLDRYQAQEIASDRFNESVDTLIEYKICTLEYDPYTPEHMAEAMDEMTIPRLNTFSELAQDFIIYGESIHFINFMRLISKEYWEQVARIDAHNEVEERSK